MNPNLLYSILNHQLHKGIEVNITVTGSSMEPTLYADDMVTLRCAEVYTIGDILVFLYKNNELLIHRLLKIESDRYFCKGDNSFRLEDVTYSQILGKVVLKNGKQLPPFSQTQLTLSYLVNRVFRKNTFIVDETKKSGLYRFYQQYIMKVEDLTMTYQKNQTMDYIQADTISLAVFDPESGDTHFFDETGVDILNCLDTPCTLPELLDKLCEIYDATTEEIRPDVENFLAECIAKKVVMVQ